MKTPLYNSLKSYAAKIKHRLHMPGHKANKGLYDDDFVRNLIDIDLTEVGEIDGLFNPRNSIKEAQKIATEIYGGREAIFLVNGASVGIVASILSILEDGDQIIIPRNSHKSIINGVILSGGRPIYLMPDIDYNTGIAMGISPLQVEKSLKENPKAKAVVITNPNFYGFSSDVAEISKVVHSYNKILLVDEACGSHFKFHKKLPLCGLEAGGDIVIHGTHKNLPAFTQSGILHINTDRINIDRLKENLAILQTTSPSYVLLSSLDVALNIVREQGEALFSQLHKNVMDFLEELRKIKGINVIDESYASGYSIKDKDFSKLVINFNNFNISGYEFEEKLLNEHGIQCELADAYNAILTFTIGDDKGVFDNVLQGIKAITETLLVKENNIAIPKLSLNFPEVVLTPKEIRRMSWETVDLEDSVGRVAFETISPFPPAVPIIRGGERIDNQVIDTIKKYGLQRPIKVLLENKNIL